MAQKQQVKRHYFYDLIYIPCEDRFKIKVYCGDALLVTIEKLTQEECEEILEKTYPDAIFRDGLIE